MEKVSLVVTVLNEAKTITILLNSIVNLRLKPNEVIIIDGGSRDQTLSKINLFAQKHQDLNLVLKTKPGNRSVGRNYGIKLAKNNLIAITDAGCELDKSWLEELLKTYYEETSLVVAGYYKAKTNSSFQQAVVPYVLVMPDKVKVDKFLPATRSMLINKKLFFDLGGFNEDLSDNEDYAFAKVLEKNKIKISFTPKAIVYWMPRESLSDFYRMIFRFARGDIFAGIVRPKVVTIFIRYLVFVLLLFVNFKWFLASLSFYSVWAIQKNKHYVASGWKFLPILQFTSDLAVMHGSISGLVKRIRSS